MLYDLKNSYEKTYNLICVIFQCKGCRNPHRPNGEKRPHSVAVSSASQKNKSSGHGGKKGKLQFLATIEGR